MKENDEQYNYFNVSFLCDPYTCPHFQIAFAICYSVFGY